MKFNNQHLLLICFFIIFMILITPSTIAVDTSKTSQLPSLRLTEPPREETVWVTGSLISPTNLNPWSIYPGFGLPLMYETLFGFNAFSQTDIPCIATDYQWNIDGSYIVVNLNPAARWSDGLIIDSDDVKYSYELAKNQKLFKEEFEKRISSFLALDNDTIRINVKQDYNFSRYVENSLKNNVPIVPKHVWSQINASYANSITGELGQEEFENDWWDPSFNSSWKVISGPYCPVYKDNFGDIVAYEYREDWWGAEADIYSELENWNEDPPRYVGSNRYTCGCVSNPLVLGYVDLYEGYYDRIWDVWENADPDSPAAYIYTWFNRSAPYHLAVSALMNLAPNHQHPDGIIAIKEFRQALAYAIDYDPIPDTAASGYWSKAKPGFIDNNSAFHAPYYNASVTEQYEKYLDISKAVALLEGIPNMVHEVNGSWSYNGTPLGPYQMIWPTGWISGIAFTDMVCEDITENLNITITTLLVDYEPTYKAMIDTNNYDFAMFVGGNQLADTPQRFLDYMRGEHLLRKNVTSWENSTFEDLWQTLETANATAYADNLDEMQEILAREVPEIPGFATPYHYQYSNYYWEGWNNAESQYQQICTTFTNDQWIIKQRLFLNLKSIFQQVEIPFISWMGLEYFLIIGIFSVIICFNLKVKFRKKEKEKEQKSYEI